MAACASIETAADLLACVATVDRTGGPVQGLRGRRVRRIKSILVGTDFSATAARAAHRAVLLAQEHGAAVRLLHAHHLPARAVLATLGAGKSTLVRLEESARERLNAEARALDGDRVRIVPVMLKRGPLEAIEHSLEREDAELVVVGARGEHTLRNFVLGTTAVRVTERVRKNVLAVRLAARSPYSRVIVCLDDHRYSALVLADAARLCPGARLHALHAFEPVLEGKMRMAGLPDSAIQEHRRAARTASRASITAVVEMSKVPARRVDVRIRLGYPPDVILRHASRIKAELIVVGRARSLLSDMLIGSVSKQILHDAHCDVAVLGRGMG
jgi:nucleotide-binding universal stress UspA family protein